MLIRQTLAANADAVFGAWVNPPIMKRWMFVTDDNEIYKAQADVRVGGAYSILEWTGSEHIDHFRTLSKSRSADSSVLHPSGAQALPRAHVDHGCVRTAGRDDKADVSPDRNRPERRPKALVDDVRYVGETARR